jgi:predicted transposase/invertase (TIGR01784 family)
VEQIAAKAAVEMTSLERWAAFFWYITDPEKRDLINEILEYEEGIEMASEVLLTVSRDEIERATLEHELKNTLDLQSKMAEAKEEGMALGFEEGREQTARNMKNYGDPVEKIALITGLSPKVIEQL